MSAPVDRDVSALCGYALVQRVAQSYLGPLWVAVDQRDGARTGAQVLLRHIQLREGTSSEARQGISRAAAEARVLQHENVLSVIEVLDDGKDLGVVYEQVAAEPLRSLQSWANMRSLPIPTGVALRVAIDVLAALESLHRTHSSASRFPSFGGLSPDSVLVSKTGETLLCDALVAGASASVEGIGSNPAKLGFTAPEQVQPGAPHTLQGDLFAVGAMLWELLTGRRLFIGSREVIERKLRGREIPKLSDALRGSHLVSPVLIGIVDSALAGDPSQRAATAHAMAKQLESCGHSVAPRHEVAQYVEKLSGQRLERRTASFQARVAQRAAPISRPESSIIIGVQPAETSAMAAAPRVETQPAAEAQLDSKGAAPLEPIEAPLAPRAPEVAELTSGAEQDAPADDPESPQEPAELGMRSTVLDAPAAAFAPATPSAAVPVPGPLPQARPNRINASRTMMGIGMPAELAPAAPKPLAARPQPPVPAQVPRAETAAEAPGHDAPAPSSERHAFSLPPAAPDVASEPSALRAPVARRNRSRTGGETSRARKVAFGVIGAAVALGALALGVSLRSSTDHDATSASLPTPAEVDAPMAAARPPAGDGLAPSQLLDPPTARADEPAATGQEDVGPAAEAHPAPAEPSRDFSAARLDDGQLAALFALEQQRDLPECAERLGKRNAAKYTGKQTKLALVRFASAKRALQSGKHEVALTELCAATAHDRSNADAQRSLAELALSLGDAALAKAAAERGIEAAKKKQKKDPELRAILGDALALLGDVPGSRKAWLETVAAGSEAQRRQRLVGVYAKAAQRALASGKLSIARIQLRRVLVLTQGSYAHSVDFAQTLLTLEQPRAALAWAERAARALPKNVRAQILLGDAHAASGEHEKARAAWRSALRVQPKNQIAARRLRSSRG